MTPGPTAGPEHEARQHIDAALVKAGWVVQDRADMNLAAGQHHLPGTHCKDDFEERKCPA